MYVARTIDLNVYIAAFQCRVALIYHQVLGSAPTARFCCCCRRRGCCNCYPVAHVLAQMVKVPRVSVRRCGFSSLVVVLACMQTPTGRAPPIVIFPSVAARREFDWTYSKQFLPGAATLVVLVCSGLAMCEWFQVYALSVCKGNFKYEHSLPHDRKTRREHSTLHLGE